MSTEQIVQMLIDERNKLDRAIAALSGGIKRRGRPPASMRKETTAEPLTETSETATKKRIWTAAQKRAAAKRMKARWAAKKKAAGAK